MNICIELTFRRVLLACVFAALVPSQAAAQDTPDWAKGLDDLLTLEVSSVARKAQRLVDASAAVYVVTRDDIRRSGLSSIPEVLRLVPGLNVSQIDGNKWAISSRGMNGRFSNKLVVLIDGRSIYTPFFAGVFWDQIDVPLAAVERIEVIRGPGASIWGANAVNGVINIITSHRAVTSRTVVSAGGGADDAVSVLHEGRINDRASYRVFGDVTAFDRVGFSGAAADDDWTQRHAGGSLHVTLNSRDSLEAAVRGVGVRATPFQRIVTSLVPYADAMQATEIDGDAWSATGRWTRQLKREGHLQVEAFFDEWSRQEMVDLHHYSIDLNLRHRVGILGRHDTMWGVGYHTSPEVSRGSLTVSLAPEEFQHHLANAFVQDDIALFGGRANAVLGTKVEYRGHLGWATQPTARLFFRLTPTQGVWAAASRALRAPDRIERSLRLNLSGGMVPGQPLPFVAAAVGNEDIGPEWLTAYEAGYRVVLLNAATVDAAAFYNRYSGIQALVEGAPRLELAAPIPYLLMPLQWANTIAAETTGGEVTTTYAPMAAVKLTGSYSLLSVKADGVVAGISGGYNIGGAPRHQGQMRVSFDLPRQIDVNAAWFAVGAIDDLQVPSYTRTDARIAWRMRPGLEWAVSGQNLFGAPHVEFDGAAALVTRASLVRRTVRLGLTWEF
jgi:iron complex outermembrane receptor protein